MELSEMDGMMRLGKLKRTKPKEYKQALKDIESVFVDIYKMVERIQDRHIVARKGKKGTVANQYYYEKR